MEILKIIEVFLNDAIKQKSLKKFKKEFPIKSIDVTTLLDKSINKLELTTTTEKANEEYRKIENVIREKLINKIYKQITEYLK